MTSGATGDEGRRAGAGPRPAPPGWLEAGIDFEHVVLVDQGELVATAVDPRLNETLLVSLTNVLKELHRDEAGEESGAWLAARVKVAAGRITLDRAFDSLPSWFNGKGPTLRALTWEMKQRSTAWRPAWATLLPPL